MIDSPIDIDRRITYDDLDFQEDCDETLWKKIKELYDDVCSRIKKSDDEFMKMTLGGHTEMYENRSDWDECQKTLRRKRLIIEWHNMQILKRERRHENEDQKPPSNLPLATDT